jgi:hypothetical protein
MLGAHSCRFSGINSTFNEREQVRVDGLGLSSRHAVRKSFVGLQHAILQ